MTSTVKITISDGASLPLVEISEDGVKRNFYTNSKELFVAIARYLGQLVRPDVQPIHPHMLYSDLDAVTVWWRPPAPANIDIRLDKDDYQSVAVPMPGLVMRVDEASYKMAAVKGAGRPVSATKLFHTPLPNIGNNHGICMGLTEREDGAYVYQCDGLWAAYWSSAFTSHSTNNKSAKYPEDVRLLLLELDGAQVFPDEDLISANITLDEFSR